MALFDFLFGSKKLPEVHDSEQLRSLLIDAASARDGKRIRALCRAHAGMIYQHFADWRKPPAAIRDDPARMECYVQGLVAVAQFFNDCLGRPELFEQLTGSPESNPLLRWQKALDQARNHMKDLRYREAADQLNNLLIDVRELKGSGADTYLPITYGSLGECYLQGGEAGKAVAPTQRALELCEQQRDAEGVSAYLGNLYEIHRFLGEPELAAGFAGRLADAFAGRSRADDAAWYRKQARLVRAGEPRNRVVAVMAGRRFELDDAPPIKEGRVQFEFERDRISLQPSRVWTQRGEERGRAGRYDDALAAFREAAGADSFDPHPRYLSGLSLLQLERAAEAVEEYRKTEELAPGWFNCRADLWLAEQIALGRLEYRAFLAVYAIEDGGLAPTENMRIADRVLTEYPDLAPVHLFRGKNLAAQGRPTEAEAAYRHGIACAAEPDVRTRLLAELAVSIQPGAEQTRLLEEAMRLNGHLVSAATAALMLRRG
jgi:tetratricopeptide (TPR) repeat protein